MDIGALLYNRADVRHFGPDKAQIDRVCEFGPDVIASRALRNCPVSYDTVAQYGIMCLGWGRDDSYPFFDGPVGRQPQPRRGRTR